MKYLLTIVLTIILIPAFAQDFDLIIINGKLIDGTGNSWRYADVGVRNGKIQSVGNLKSATAKRIIDARQMIVAPGFIDVHTHIEGNDLKVPMAPNFIHDGVTTVITGNCGSSNTDIGRYFFKLDSTKLSINVATLIGHNSVRRAVMGESQRDPSAEEQKQMEELVAAAMRQGAVGFSTGLIYIPGTFSKTPEVVGLAKAAATNGGVYASHIRSEGDDVTNAVEEAIDIGRKANIPVQISHFKVTYKPNWGRSTETLAQVEKARTEGIDVTIDQYPYVASSTTLNTTLPSWAFSGGRDSLLLRLADQTIRKKIREEMVQTLKKKKLKSYSYAVVARYGADTTMNGKNISEVNLLMKRKAKPDQEAETILDMVGKGSAQMVFFSINEEDLRRIMRYPFNMFASDAGIARFGSGVPHPRSYGTNARVLGTYVRELKIISLEEAIRRMTSLPAQKFNLRDRGLLREGFAADILILDPATVDDKSTFAQPHAYSTGIQTVIVNGVVTVENGKHTGERNGMTLRGPGTTTIAATGVSGAE
jgi:N-acyl-D-amino-acid deacylase